MQFFLLPWLDNSQHFLCWPRCKAGLGPAAGAHFLPEILHSFYATPRKPPIFWLWRTRLNGIIREGFQKKLSFFMTFAINHTPTPLMALVATHLPLAIDKQRVTWTALAILASFSFAIDSYIYEKRILHLVSVKVLLQLVQNSGWSNRWLPYSALFRLTSTTIHM